MADQLLDRLRAEPPAPTPLDVDALWESGRRRRRRSAAATASTTLTVLAMLALLTPGLLDLTRPDVPPAILDRPETGSTEDGFLSDRAIWAAPPGNDADSAAAIFITATEPGWTEGFTTGGLDVPDSATETIITAGEDGGISIHLHLFREPEAPDRWYVVAVDSDDAPLTQQDGRAVVPLEPVAPGAVEVTIDRRTPDGTDTVTVPVADLPEEVGEDPAGAGVRWMLLRYRDADGRLLDARGATWAGPWADVIEADTSLAVEAVPEGDPQLRFELDAVWTSPSVPDLESAAWQFGLHAFGWHDGVVVEEGPSDDGARWLRIGDAFADDAEVDVLFAPDPVHPDAWHVLQVGDGELRLVGTELRFGPVPTEAVTAVVAYGSDRAYGERDAGRGELTAGAVGIPHDPGFGEITAAQVRFLDADGRMVGAIGTTFADEPGGGIGLPANGPRDP